LCPRPTPRHRSQLHMPTSSEYEDRPKLPIIRGTSFICSLPLLHYSGLALSRRCANVKTALVLIARIARPRRCLLRCGRMSNKRIVIVEDERDMADLVATRLRREGYEVEVANDGIEGLTLIRSKPPDLVLLDIMLPGMPGTEIAAKLRDDPRTVAVPIIMLTAKSEESDIVVGLRFGADDYVTKPFSMSVLVARIDALLRRAASPQPQAKAAFKAGPLLIDQQRYLVELEGRPLALTLTEFRLLAALAAANGRVLSRNQLMDQAMGLDVVVTDRTIDVHITTLRRKLGKARECIQTVRGVGYRFVVGKADGDD
jgi:DNA-binding response OmpR family regulator